MATLTKQFDRFGRAAMSQSCLCSEPRPASPALLSGNSRRENFFLDASTWQVEAHVSRGGLMGSDGASLGWTVGAFVDPIASSPNLYEYCDDNPLNATDPTGLMTRGECLAAKAKLEAKYKSYFDALGRGEFCKNKPVHISISCAECNDIGGAEYTSSGVIILYYGPKTMPADYADILVAHELVHAADTCFGGFDKTNGKQAACSEIRAYCYMCYAGSPWRKDDAGHDLSYADCIRKNAAASLKAMKFSNVNSLIDAAWKDCFVAEGTKQLPPWPYTEECRKSQSSH